MTELMAPFQMPIAQEIWEKKYRFQDKFSGEVFDNTVQESWQRIAAALAEPETAIPDGIAHSPNLTPQEYWAREFYDALDGFKFLPAGRITAGAGTSRRVTLFNCFVMGTIPDSMSGIFDMLKEAALTMQQGGGIGYDFSTLRPKGAQVKQVAADASGPLTFMDVWDAMCRTVMSAGSRRGAMMATMRCDHPDIEEYIVAKHDQSRLRMFNMSVLVTDAFMDAVKADKPWDLSFNGKVYKTVSARELWDQIMQSTYDSAEPGVIFIDRINQDNNLKYMETISATNPCGEQPLPPYGACLLGSINLAALVTNPYTEKAGIETAPLRHLVRTAVRMMDNVNDISLFPLPEQLAEAQAKRRIGLGITGLADALLMCGVKYGTDSAAEQAEKWMRFIALEAYQVSIDLAREKGAFPALDRAQYLNSGQFAAVKLPGKMKQEIMEVGIRNSHLLSIAPTGTISLYAGNLSSGVEPIFAASYDRKLLQDDGSKTQQRVVDYAVKVWEDMLFGEVKDTREIPEGENVNQVLPPAYVDAQTLAPFDHIKMQAAVQKWVDTSISKTINCPVDISFKDFKDVYMAAWDEGCKGCTTYRPNDITGSVISVEEAPKEEPEELTPLTDKLLLDEAYAFMQRDPGNREKLREKLAELQADKVKDLTGPSRIDEAHMLYHWMVEQSEPKLMTEEESTRIAKAQSALTAPYGEDGVRDRPFDTAGHTYKVKLGSDPAFYVTINDTEENGQRRPFEIFIVAKNPEHMQWTSALTLMLSAVFRRPHDSRFVVEELKSVFNPKGGGWWGGRYWNSTVAAIGRVIEIHMIRIGYINDPNVPSELAEGGNAGRMSHENPNPQFVSRHAGGTVEVDPAPVLHQAGPEMVVPPRGPSCAECHSSNMRISEGCMVCNDCGASKCG